MQVKDFLHYELIGLMSGTSLDGVDICHVDFFYKNNKWSYKIHNARTQVYPAHLLKQLKNAVNLSGLELFSLDQQLGVFFGECINNFIADFSIQKNAITAIASHGHTVFHQPDKGLTVQIGCGESIAYTTGINTINDFRTKDVLHGGQGAPLVPIGDQLLFSEQADAFLNIGGFANFSVLNTDATVTAFDICPANIIINYFTRQLGLEYDKDGTIASAQTPDDALLNLLNEIDAYNQPQPPSLGWEWIEQVILPVYEHQPVSIEVKIATATEHAAFQIARRLNEYHCKSVFITGGGTKNTFLISRIEHYFNGKIVIPDEETIDFKEALIFAFLGVLHLENIPNCLPSVTGASKAVVGGVMHRA